MRETMRGSVPGLVLSPAQGAHECGPARGDTPAVPDADVQGQPPASLAAPRSESWFGPAVRGIGAASLLSDLGHEVPTALLPSFLTSTLGAPAAALGLIEGVADGLAGAARRGGGALADDPDRRRATAVGGYTANLGVEPTVDLLEVADLDAATELRFLGSPTVRVNGRDVEPGAELRREFVLSCRVYQTEQGVRRAAGTRRGFARPWRPQGAAWPCTRQA